MRTEEQSHGRESMPESSGSDVSNSCVAADLDQTVGQYLRGSFPFGGFRQRVLNSDLLDSVTLRDCAFDPDRMEAFLLKCRGIPQCGDIQITRMRAAIRSFIEARAAAAN